MNFPSQFRCAGVDDFIGPAKAIAAHLRKRVRLSLEQKPPLAYALSGPPGVGKSELASYLTGLLGANRWTTYEKNGCSFRIEEVEEWSLKMHLTEMFGNYRVFRIEEADRASSAAQVALLTMLDRMPAGNAFIMTTNRPIKEFEARLQRRFAFFDIAPPSVAEITDFLVKRFDLDPRAALNCANSAVLGQGYVGQALKDAEEWLIAKAA